GELDAASAEDAAIFAEDGACDEAARADLDAAHAREEIIDLAVRVGYASHARCLYAWADFEHVVDDDRLVALRPDGDDIDRDIEQALDVPDVVARLLRQVIPRAAAAGRVAPAFDLFVDRLNLRHHDGARWHRRQPAAVFRL